MKMKRKLALLLIFCLLITSMHVSAFASVYEGKGEYFTKDQMGEWKWEDYKKYYGIPLLTPYKNPKNFFFNIELWQDLNITAYGDYDKVPRNDFKNATLRGYSGGDLTEGIKNKGYYEKDGQLGEYRYHGYDANGNPYVNLHFPADSDSGRKPEAKKWIYRVWDSSSPYFLNASGQKRIGESSNYYKISISTARPIVAANTKAMIEETLPFNIVASTNADKEAYNYVHVDTAPTTRFGGEALMYHQSDIVYYQKFSLNKIVQSKLNLPMKASVQASYQGVSLAEDLAKKIDLVFDVKVSGVLQDDALFGSATTYEGVPIDVAKTNYYTRLDIKNWTLKLKDTLTGKTITLNNVQPSKNIGEGIFEVKIPYDAYKGQLNLNSDAPKDITVNFEGDAIANFYNNKSLQDKATTSVDVSAPNIKIEITGDPTGGKEETSPPVIEPPITYEPVKMDIEAPRYMLDTETFKIINNSEVPDTASFSVSLEGQELSESERDLFLSGQYLFPLIGMDKIYTYTVNFFDMLGQETSYSSYIYVYTVKPKTQFKTTGTFKENRKITVSADYERNSAYLREKVTFDILKFNASTLKSNNIFFRTQNASVLEFIVKDEDMLNLSMQIQSNVPAQYIERSDIPNGYMISNVFDQEIQVHRDYEPAIIANIWSSVMIRGESLELQYDASSYDGDLISKNNYKIYYDQNQDGVPEQLVKQGKWSEYTGYVANKLGTYKIVFDIEESFGEATLEEFISAADLRKKTTERYFYVENVAPVTAIETDIPVDIEKVDVFVLNDHDITREMNNDIKNKRVDWINALQFESGVSANLQIWDLHTYIESKPMSLSVNTGGYPPSTYN